MKELAGKPISPGFARGHAVVFLSGRGVAPPRRRLTAGEIEREVARLQTAVESAAAELGLIRQRVEAEIGGAPAAIFDAHAAMLRDPKLVARIEAHIAEHRVNAEQAVHRELDAVARKLAASGDAMLRERVVDLRDLARRLVWRLQGGAGAGLLQLPEDSILVADELMPSDTVRLDRRHVRGIVMERCGRTSHAAILAKALGIPAVSDIHDVARRVRTGTTVLIDGVSGIVVTAPTTERARRFAADAASYEQGLAAARELETGECLTRDGTRIELYANIGRVTEAPDVRAHHLDGVGLFRTEVLFLDHLEPPTRQEQVEAYASVARTLDGLPLVIRTLDLSADKRPAFLPPPSGHNPTLGLRGLRLALRESRLLRTQLEAIVEVAQTHPVDVLLPMVLGGSDLRAAIELVQSVARDAGYARLPRVGAMIETPSSLFTLDRITALADFLSIGTNDLTQFVLAADRDAVGLIDEYSLLHPSVLRAVRQVVQAAQEAGLPLSVCGEAAGDPVLVPVLVGLGVRSISMSPARAAAVRRTLRELDVAEAGELAGDLLACEGLEAARQRLAANPTPAAPTA